MENKILKGFISDYLSNFGIEELNEATQFEHFCNYCMFTLNCRDAYRYDNMMYLNVHTGSSGDKAIDGVMILVNDNVITDAEQIDKIINKKKFEVSFIFVQAKTSATFDSGDMLKTGFGIKDLFTNNKLKANPNVMDVKYIIDKIYDRSAQFKSNPTCKIYYITTGKWLNDQNLVSIKDDCCNQLKDLNIFNEIDYIPVDANRLISVYKEIKNAISREIVISKMISFPPNIKGVEQAYLGLVQFDEYLKLITDDNGDIITGLFYDNVRSYLGENPVNKEIIATLSDKEKYIQFPILNNGITIVTRNLNPSGDKYALTDYQIVNGCQTSNVLYECRGRVSKDLVIPIKIIHTDDPELIVDVIRSTNRQTQVLDEAFESLKQFHKSLQDFYNSYKGDDKIYYERRTHEYDYYGIDIRKMNVISLPSQLLSFMSMFLEEPHSTHRYYGELLSSNKDKLFQEDHLPIMYYTSAWTLHKVEQAFLRHEISSEWRKYRYHILLLIQVYIRELKKMKQLPRFNSKEMSKLCENIISAVSNDKTIGAMLRLFVPILENGIANMKQKELKRNGPSKRKEFTNLIINLVKIRNFKFRQMDLTTQKKAR